MWLDPANPQLNKNGELHHLLSLEGLPADILRQILDTAESFVGVTQREVKKVPLLRGKAVFNLFFEASTRTRTTFEIAAKRLSADVINLDINKSSTAKGESLLDTIANLSAMHADMFVVRHSESGAPYLIAQHVAPALPLQVRVVARHQRLIEDDVRAGPPDRQQRRARRGGEVLALRDEGEDFLDGAVARADEQLRHLVQRHLRENVLEVLEALQHMQ